MSKYQSWIDITVIISVLVRRRNHRRRHHFNPHRLIFLRSLGRRYHVCHHCRLSSL